MWRSKGPNANELFGSSLAKTLDEMSGKQSAVPKFQIQQILIEIQLSSQEELNRSLECGMQAPMMSAANNSNWNMLDSDKQWWEFWASSQSSELPLKSLVLAASSVCRCTLLASGLRLSGSLPLACLSPLSTSLTRYSSHTVKIHYKFHIIISIHYSS